MIISVFMGTGYSRAENKRVVLDLSVHFARCMSRPSVMHVYAERPRGKQSHPLTCIVQEYYKPEVPARTY